MTISDPGSVSPATRWHLLPAEKVLEQLQSDRQLGLTSEQVAERQRQFGPNELEDTGGRSNWAILLDQFKNIMLIMLIAVAIISGVMDLMDMQAGRVKSNDIPFKDTVAILAIVFLNGLLGYVQESRAEKALAALKNMASPRVRVVRDGRVQEVSAGELVPGDIMLLEAGVQVAADGRLLEEASLQVREAALTGEAQAVCKRVSADLSEDTPLGDRLNCVYQGTEVVQGRGVAIVTQTGMGTELGKIATLLQSVEAEPTPLQQRMDQLSQALVTGSLSLVAVVVVLGLLVAGWGKLRELVEVSLSMAVAVVPEGLPAVITVTLALGTQRMVRRHALIRKLPAVETLGSVTTICSDKTGTLTQNKMVVQGIHQHSCSLSVTGHAYTPEGEFLLNGQPIDARHHPEAIALLTAGLLCNDAALQKENGDWCILGDPTEGALLVAATKAGLDRHQLSYAWTRLGEFPFTSERKRMSVMVKQAGGGTTTDAMGAIAPLLLPSSSLLLFCKGSPELVLERCQFVYVKGTVEPLSGDCRQQILQQNNHLASKGLRVLGFAGRPLEALPTEDSAEETEQGLIWLGLVDMLDAPRPEAREAVARCRSAGIRPVMITGDHQLTARAIAEDLGIAQPGDEVLTGPDLEHCTPEELEAHVERVSVYARVAPEHKLKIVQALQRRHHIVAMTGDGVNDAPALKRADIGIAMGITGTDVSKEASDMVLLDDNFATIVSAVEEGRVVYTNIRRFIKYILGSNIGEVITIAASPLFAFGGVPLTPLQILWMNLVTDGLPALALAVEPAEPNVMSRPPHDSKESIFARGLGTYMIRIGVVLSIIAIAQMVVGYHLAQTTPGDPDRWKTMVFTTLCLAQMGHALAIRSNTRLTLELNPFSNPYVLTSVVFTSLLQLALIYVEPLRNFFGTQILSPLELLICLGFSLLLFVWIELEKLLSRWQGKGSGVGD
ncbi:cation-translocating P-type ATPase [Thermoleptolyngbya sp. M55_K2018_002]|uniref:cation-translocating P-type ATPase n=1 Tax=Thermoleptolyngbya sp. M55_K2018_002 TaxID=2747808 RepID=UPI0019DECA44|nr:cation-translocating P-type ATPase [Thermoleptolyngbya sp. M55_K2018_002]HIK43165.1 cation-translocating P-type ATPase [Thermoleptolyngbya sp. M55_K2018_002]